MSNLKLRFIGAAMIALAMPVLANAQITIRSETDYKLPPPSDITLYDYKRIEQMKAASTSPYEGKISAFMKSPAYESIKGAHTAPSSQITVRHTEDDDRFQPERAAYKGTMNPHANYPKPSSAGLADARKLPPPDEVTYYDYMRLGERAAPTYQGTLKPDENQK